MPDAEKSDFRTVSLKEIYVKRLECCKGIVNLDLETINNRILFSAFKYTGQVLR